MTAAKLRESGRTSSSRTSWTSTASTVIETIRPDSRRPSRSLDAGIPEVLAALGPEDLLLLTARSRLRDDRRFDRSHAGVRPAARRRPAGTPGRRPRGAARLLRPLGDGGGVAGGPRAARGERPRETARLMSPCSTRALAAAVAPGALGLLLVLVNLASIPRLPRAGGAPPRDSPLLSVVIPARDEERDIESAVRGASGAGLSEPRGRRRRGPLDGRDSGDTRDGSRGRTRASASSPDGSRRPAGSESRTLSPRGAAAARGKLLLFADADVRYDPRALCPRRSPCSRRKRSTFSSSFPASRRGASGRTS